MQIIPPGEKTRPVRIRLIHLLRMMNGVHSRCCDDQDEPSLNLTRDPKVGMMKKNRGKEDRLPEPHYEWISADNDDLHGSIDDRQGELPEMKSQRGRRIEVAVHVMWQMEAPEK